MREQNAVLVKYVSVPTDCVSSRNTSCRGTGLKVTMNRRLYNNNNNNNNNNKVIPGNESLANKCCSLIKHKDTSLFNIIN
jgi:hypothetical protein